jgi:enoyl-CoA hydratase
MSYETILYERRGPVAVLRLNRPERMNAVIEEMYLELQAALAGAARAPDVRVLVLTGSVRVRDGEERQAFSAGADLKKHAAGERTRAEQRAYIALAHETARALYEHPRPVIAAVNGPARGAGAELALACDLVLMAETATIAFPETGLGTFVGGGATRHLAMLVGLARARELVYTGRVLDGVEAAAIGLALRAVPLDRLLDEAMSLAETIAEKAPISIAMAKQRLAQPHTLDLTTVLQQEADAILACMDTEDWREGIVAFGERRQPQFRGR